ncbi:hypothetical protein ACTNDN_06760 [Niallia sp. HCP3S3_B10]|uniref:hypothetical protein n=1 Tax=Niallia sp. HCP3S3_B10 TaxID=3438944 RepID=UPI003F88B9D4
MFEIDFFDNSLLIDKKTKLDLNHQIIQHLRSVKSYIKSISNKANLYLVGSLARKEPSIRRNGTSNYELMSDFDFFILVPDFLEVKYLYDIDITKKLNDKFPTFHNSIILKDVDHLEQVNSLVGHDVINNLRHPILEQFRLDTKRIKVPAQLTKYDYLDSIVSQIAVIVTENEVEKESILYKNTLTYYKSKFISESVKGLTKSQLLSEATEKLVSYGYSLKSIINIIKLRELNEYNETSNESCFFEMFCERHFKKSSLELVKMLAVSDDKLRKIQALFILEYFEYSNKRTNNNQSTDLNILRDRVLKNLIHDNSINTTNLRKIRLHYLKLMNDKNIGLTMIPDLKGVEVE